MGKRKRKVPGLNNSSTADISFMLLIFFLMTTSMDTDMGLERRLPQPPEDEEVKQEMKIKERNVMEVRLNSVGQLWIKDGNGSGWIDNFGSSPDILRQRARAFIQNEGYSSVLPEHNPKKIDGIGNVMVTDKHVISVQTDRGTPYDVYFFVQNELVAVYNELRNEEAKKRFGRPYDALSDDDKSAIRQIYPQNISEAEPKNYAQQK